jgi:hypothetical protein
MSLLCEERLIYMNIEDQQFSFELHIHISHTDQVKLHIYEI